MTLPEVKSRLEEIANIRLQELGDEEVLRVLEERKHLLEEQKKLEAEEKKRAEEEERQAEEVAKKRELEKNKALQKKENDLLERLAQVNKSISPDQEDEALLALIQERKVLEAELKVLSADASPEKTQPAAPTEESVSEQVAPEEESVAIKVETPSQTEENDRDITIKPEVVPPSTTHVSESGKTSASETNRERISVDPSLQTEEFQSLLRELRANTNSLGTFLQGLPVTVKRNRAFMLEVAKIDPAYAMHYADKDTLKKDEHFNIAIAGMNNQRNTGNPVSEMLPEMRTGAVLLAAVKNDFRNVRFVRPEMAEYEEILRIAQKGGLEAVKQLKNALDVKFLLPLILQKDKAFMKEVESIVAKN